MPICPDKYRGTPKYFIAFSEIITAARYGGTITYQELAIAVGFPLTGNALGAMISQLLGEISEDEHLRGRPMLSAIVTKKDGTLGEGFFNLARDLDLLTNDSLEGRKKFCEDQKKAIYHIWRTPIRTVK